MKKCTRCGNRFKESEFPFTNKAKGKRFSMCKECKKEYDREYWAKTKDVRNERKRRNSKSIQMRNRRYVFMHYQKTGCVECGEKDVAVLEFDHVRGGKVDNIAEMVRKGASLDALKREIAKCDVVCANCHRRRTAVQFNWYAGLI